MVVPGGSLGGDLEELDTDFGKQSLGGYLEELGCDSGELWGNFTRIFDSFWLNLGRISGGTWYGFWKNFLEDLWRNWV